MPTTMNISLPDNRLLHREKAGEQEKLEILRRAVSVGIEDWRNGHVDDRPIDEILDGIDEEEA